MSSATTGIKVRVSALFPSKQCTANGNPVASTRSPTRICGSTRRSLLMPTLRRSSSFSASKYKVVQSYMINDSPVVALAWARHACDTVAR